MLPILSDEDRDVPSCVRVPAHRLSSSFSDTALASGLVLCSAFLFTRRDQAQQAPPSTQAAHSTRLSGLLPFFPRLNRCGSVASACAPLARGEKPAGSPPLA
jgi:hypothetical protein